MMRKNNDLSEIDDVMRLKKWKSNITYLIIFMILSDCNLKNMQQKILKVGFINIAQYVLQSYQ